MIRVVIIFFAALLLCQCAQQTPITGGERDISAPQIDTLKMESPPNRSTNFVQPTIEINFNELVVLKDADKQILITPFLDTKPEIYTKGKKVIVDFKAPLSPNTTYIINFGDAIVDITEGNIFKNYKYVFSTGSFIDSLQYNAFVYNSFTKKPEKDILVMLYRDQEDSVVNKIKPSYFAKTNLAGMCNIQNIAAGKYKIVALLDKNGNYKYDPKEESIGFLTDNFDAENDTLADTIGIFQSTPKSLEITTSTVSAAGRGLIVLNKSIEDGKIIFSDSILENFLDRQYQLSPTRDTIRYWVSPQTSENKKYPMMVDSCKKFNTYLKQPTDSTLKFSTNGTSNLKPQEDLFFDFSQPIQRSDALKIKLLEDTISINFELVQTSPTKFLIAADYKIDHNYQLEMLPGAFESFYGVKNDTIGALFEKSEDNQYGNLKISIQPSVENNFILELLENDKVKIRKSYAKSELNSLSFDLLNPGIYSMRLIFDYNNNNLWDTGNYYEHIAPERVEYYTDKIEIRKGWDLDLTWILK